MPRTHERGQVGQLYFIASEDQDAMKIGFGKEVAMRLVTLQTGNPAKLSLVGYFNAQYGAERLIHTFLAPHRVRLEWFRMCDDVEAVLEACKDVALEKGVSDAAEIEPEATGVEALYSALRISHLTEQDVAEALEAVAAGEYVW